MRGEAVNAVQGQHVRGAGELLNGVGELACQRVQVFTRNGRGEGATHLGEGAEQQVRGVRLVSEHAFEEFGVLRDGGADHFREQCRRLTDLR